MATGPPTSTPGSRFTNEATRQDVDLDDASFWKGVRGTIGGREVLLYLGRQHAVIVLHLVRLQLADKANQRGLVSLGVVANVRRLWHGER